MRGLFPLFSLYLFMLVSGWKGVRPMDYQEFCRLLEELRPRLVVWAMRRTPEDAEDLAQDTLLLALKNWKQFDRTRGTLQSWVSGIMRNRHIDLTRSPHARATFTSIEDGALTRVSVEPTQESTCLIMEGVRRVARLPASVQETLRLSFLGYTDTEIAAMRSLPHGTIKSHIQKSRVKIMRELALS